MEHPDIVCLPAFSLRTGVNAYPAALRAPILLLDRLPALHKRFTLRAILIMRMDEPRAMGLLRLTDCRGENLCVLQDGVAVQQKRFVLPIPADDLPDNMRVSLPDGRICAVRRNIDFSETR